MAQLRLCNSLRDSAPASFQHEVIALSEKVIVRLEDLVKWTVPDFSGWDNSLKAEPLKPSVLRELGTNGRREALHRYRESTLTSGLNFKDVQRERAQLGELRQRPQFLFSLLWGYFYYFPSFQKVTVVFPFSLGCCVECLCICVPCSPFIITCLLSFGWFNKCCLDWSNSSVRSWNYSRYNELRITLIQAG